MANKITPIGYGDSQNEACDPVLINKGDIEVAIFASVTLGLEAWMYLENQPGMCQATIEDLGLAIQNFKMDHPNTVVIVTLHWGAEYHIKPTSIQRRHAKLLIEAGTDVIIGHHPHVVQSFESIMGKPVFYSIGNLIFDNQNPITHDGILVKLIVSSNQYIKTEIIPYHTSQYKPAPMIGNQKSNFMKSFQRRSDPLPE